jgi:hypothetical protein
MSLFLRLYLPSAAAMGATFLPPDFAAQQQIST